MPKYQCVALREADGGEFHGLAALSLQSEPDADRRGATICIEQALAAAQRLIGASGIDLIAYNRENCTATLVASTGNSVSNSPDLLALMEAETAFLLRESVPHWMKARDAGTDDSLVVKLIDQSGTTLFLLMSLTDIAGVARARAVRLVPDLITLVRFHVNLTARARDLEEMRDAATEALDQGECGVIALRADHSVVFANTAASAHLFDGSTLRLRRGRLRLADGASANRFSAALEQVIEPDAFERHGKRPRARVMLLGEGEAYRQPFIVVIAPAGSAIEQQGKSRGAAAIVYILQPSVGAVRGLEALCQLHGLSRVESRLIAHLMGGMTLIEAATEMRIKGETARTYLKQIFAKTGIHRQADLTAMMTRYLRAVRGDFDFQPA